MNIAIIGGGITGLTAAYELLKCGHGVTVFEKEKTLGGLAGGFTMPNWDWSLEFFYHHFFTNDSALISLAKELGLEKKMLILHPITSMFIKTTQRSTVSEKNCADRFPSLISSSNAPRRDKKNVSDGVLGQSFASSGANNFFCEQQCSERQIYQLDSPLNLLTFPLLSSIDKFRTALVLGFCKLNPFWRGLEKITAEKFFKTLGGSTGWHILWKPLMVGKFGTFANHVPASWLWARFHKRTMKLRYFKGGFQTLVDRLSNEIKKRGGKIYTNRMATTIYQSSVISHQPSDFSITYVSEGRKLKAESFHAILITIPSSTATRLLKFPKSYEQKLKSIPHLYAQTLVLESDKPILEKTYWLNIADPSFPFVAVVAHTNMIDKKYYGGRHITYIGNYLPDNHPFLKMTKKQLLKIFLPYIQLINKQCNNVAMKQCYLFTAPAAQPIQTLNYSQKVPAMKTPIDGIYLANLDSIYPWDRGINYAVELGQKAADAMTKK